MSDVCVNQKELAARWKISHRTLERWRWAQEGPRYLKLGGRVVYALLEIADDQWDARVTVNDETLRAMTSYDNVQYLSHI